jgi:hypothetical protein
VWKRSVEGRALTFRLAGINNQNFLMRDEETGSYWQQISGKAISGLYRGKQLELVHSDELSFGLWRAENSQGTVLRPVEQFASKYEAKDWETTLQKARTVVDTRNTSYEPRELMLGVEHNGVARAYVLQRVLQQKLVEDRIGATPVIVLVGPDEKSIRVFEAHIKGYDAVPEFYREAGKEETLLIDSLTGSHWNFQGCAIQGPAHGECLLPLPALKDYWFDWHLYHPHTTVNKM